MEIAQLVLDYVKVLIWPVLVGAVVFGFREQIRERIEALKEAKTPIAQATFFEKQAQGVQEKAAHAALSVFDPRRGRREEKLHPPRDTTRPEDGEPREAHVRAELLVPEPLTAPKEHWFATAAGTVLEGADFSVTLAMLFQ